MRIVADPQVVEGGVYNRNRFTMKVLKIAYRPRNEAVDESEKGEQSAQPAAGDAAAAKQKPGHRHESEGQARRPHQRQRRHRQAVQQTGQRSSRLDAPGSQKEAQRQEKRRDGPIFQSAGMDDPEGVNRAK